MRVLIQWAFIQKKDFKIAISFLVIGIVMSYGVRFFRSHEARTDVQERNSQHASGAQKYTIQGITVSSVAQEALTAQMTRYVVSVFNQEYVPARFEIQKVTNPASKSNEYIGSWYKGDKIFYVFAVMPDGSETPSYLRAWALVPGEKITAQTAASLIGTIFHTGLRNRDADFICQNIKDPHDSNEQHACGFMQSLADGSKRGISVRAPISITAGYTMIFIAACSVPADHAALYFSPQCL